MKTQIILLSLGLSCLLLSQNALAKNIEMSNEDGRFTYTETFQSRTNDGISTITPLDQTKTKLNDKNFYIKGGVGQGNLTYHNITGEKHRKSLTSQTFGIGWQSDFVDLSLNYTNYGKLKFKDEYYSGSVKAQSIHLNGLLYPFVSGFYGTKPYVGVSIGQSSVKQTLNNEFLQQELKKNYFLIGGLAGIKIPLHNRIEIDLGGRITSIFDDSKDNGIKNKLIDKSAFANIQFNF